MQSTIILCSRPSGALGASHAQQENTPMNDFTVLRFVNRPFDLAAAA